LFSTSSFDDKIPSSLRCSRLPLAENLRPIDEEEDPMYEIFARKPICGFDEEKVIVPKTQQRQIPKIPYKVLDAPALQDDYYLNLVDWSELNDLVVGLSSCIYIWSATSSKVTKLSDLGTQD
jgi:cell division cycle 20-like protein 1 (cofactor of APC complex)